jgi:hypothetical protein
MYVVDFKHDFPPVYGEAITIPTDSLFFRGYDTRFPVVSSHPSHFGNYETAREYANQEFKKLGQFVTTKNLKVVDLRYLQVFLRDLFRNRTETNDEILDIILSCSLAYGLCSFKRQLHLLDIRYNKRESKAMEKYYNKTLDKSFVTQPMNFDIIEAQGVRIAETTNDGIVLSFLSKLFQNENIDGFIAPSFFSPYHIEKYDCKTSPELVIFDPSRSGIIHVDMSNSVIPLKITDLINRQFVHKSIAYKTFMKTIIKGGSSKNTNKIHDFENFFHSLDDKDLLQKVENAKRAAVLLSKNGIAVCSEKPYPSLLISPWKVS